MNNRIRNLMLDAILGEELVTQGYRLEQDEDFAYLYFRESLVGRYNAKTVPAQTLRQDAYGHMSRN